MENVNIALKKQLFIKINAIAKKDFIGMICSNKELISMIDLLDMESLFLAHFKLQYIYY